MGLLGSFMDDVGQYMKSAMAKAGRWIKKIADKIERWFQSKNPHPSALNGMGNMDWVVVSKYLLLILIAIIGSVLAIVLWRTWRGRKTKSTEVVAEFATNAVPDLKDENVQADELPFDRWQALAQELMARGEFRLALRALYLSSLAYLAGRELLTILRSKSNREYERELSRRAHSQPSLLSAFRENVQVFEKSWYGLHEVNEATYHRFHNNHRMIEQQ
jgi:hypothetical protein